MGLVGILALQKRETRVNSRELYATTICVRCEMAIATTDEQADEVGGARVSGSRGSAGRDAAMPS